MASAVPLIVLPSSLKVAVGVLGAIISGKVLLLEEPLSLSSKAKPRPIAPASPKPAFTVFELNKFDKEKSDLADSVALTSYAFKGVLLAVSAPSYNNVSSFCKPE